MRCVAVSDTHGQHDRLTVPDGDVFIHAGDFTREGTQAEVAAFNEWLDTLPHRHKVVVAGNHEHVLDTEERGEAAASLLDAAHYLHDDAVVIDGIMIWGSPWVPEPWPARIRSTAFGRSPQQLRSKQAAVPDETDILVTHGPPHGVGDRLSVLRKRTGSPALRETVDRIRPRYHVFGHVHEGYGQYQAAETTFLNAAMSYIPLVGGRFNRLGNDPFVFHV